MIYTVYEKNDDDALELVKHKAEIIESVNNELMIKIKDMGMSNHKAWGLEKTKRGIVAVRFIKLQNHSIQDRDVFIVFDDIKDKVSLEQLHNLIEKL